MTDDGHDHIRASAYELGAQGKALGWPRNPAKIPEVNQTLRGLENGSEIARAVYFGYAKGWDSA